MQSVFSVLTPHQETQGTPHQTTRFDPAKGDEQRVQIVAAQLLIHALASPIHPGSSGDWLCRRNEGSYTLQNERDRRQVVTIFVDYEDRLATQNGLAPHDEPHIVVATELTYLPAYVKHLVRADLRQRHGDHYIDPEAGGRKYHLLPNLDHCFDIHFPHGGCDLNPDILTDVRKLTGNGID